MIYGNKLNPQEWRWPHKNYKKNFKKPFKKQKRLDVNWKLACSGAELKSFCVQDKVSGGIELLSSIGIGSADTSRWPCSDNSNLLPNNPTRQW
jgi:hypothetical protein